MPTADVSQNLAPGRYVCPPAEREDPNHMADDSIPLCLAPSPCWLRSSRPRKSAHNMRLIVSAFRSQIGHHLRRDTTH
jgi:hypothetical protein